MLITFKCTACGQLISFSTSVEEVKQAKSFPFPVVIQHGDHAQVVYLDKALGIREVEIARHAETLLDHFIGFINEAFLTEKDLTTQSIGESIGRQIGEFLLDKLHEKKPFLTIPDTYKKQGEQKVIDFLKRDWKNLWEVLTSSMKSVFSGGTIEYLIDDAKPEHVSIKVTDNPFCRSMVGEKNQKSCDLLAGIIVGAVSSMRADKLSFECKEVECHVQTKKGVCTFDLNTTKSASEKSETKKKG